uniref:Uncharacterized protein n=1 Tax=Rousettus aegyptiacus TaxID=9407 RepID=A0A7J8GVX4_ROUAE|nr:hypothetical protein HJG63_001656 [Rousettus aegyptiacus]
MHKPLYVEKQLGSLRDRALWETVSAAGEAGAAHQFSTGKRKQGATSVETGKREWIQVGFPLLRESTKMDIKAAATAAERHKGQ